MPGLDRRHLRFLKSNVQLGSGRSALLGELSEDGASPGLLLFITTCNLRSWDNGTVVRKEALTKPEIGRFCVFIYSKSGCWLRSQYLRQHREAAATPPWRLSARAWCRPGRHSRGRCDYTANGEFSLKAREHSANEYHDLALQLRHNLAPCRASSSSDCLLLVEIGA